MAHKLKNRLIELIYEKEARENRRIFNVEISRAIHVSSRTIASWIRNDVTKFEAHIVEGLCLYFQCELCDLLYLEEITESHE